MFARRLLASPPEITVPEFRLPGGADRTVVIGATGTGKTTAGAWILSKQRFDKRAWVCIDFKNEELWDLVGSPPMRELRVWNMPGRRGLYRLRIRPGEEEALDNWLWKIWRKENIGLFCDEVSLMKGSGFKAILRQGRSKHIPVISCTQRPVDCDREVFTESQFKVIFTLDDERDYKVIKGFTRGAPIERPLPKYWSYWWQGSNSPLFYLRPTPPPDSLALDLRRVIPYSSFFG